MRISQRTLMSLKEPSTYHKRTFHAHFWNSSALSLCLNTSRWNFWSVQLRFSSTYFWTFYAFLPIRNIHGKRLKEDLRLKLYPCFYDILLLILWRKGLVQSLWRFGQISRNYEVTKFWIQRKWRHAQESRKHFTPGFLCNFFLVLWRKSLL